MPKGTKAHPERPPEPPDPLLDRLSDAFLGVQLFYTDEPERRATLARIWVRPVLTMLRQRPELVAAIVAESEITRGGHGL